MRKIINDLVEKLKSEKLTISSVESLTAGLFCSEIASIPGASAILRGGIVTYASDCKVDLANVKSKSIEKYGVISKIVAREMALGGKEKLKSDICVSFTGNAGPAVLENKKVGEVFIGIAFNNVVNVYHRVFKGNRNEIRKKSVLFASKKILRLLEK